MGKSSRISSEGTKQKPAKSRILVANLARHRMAPSRDSNVGTQAVADTRATSDQTVLAAANQAEQ
ncbi:hypothetical protein HT746_14235 [Burkholderia pyrrocinia]|uniref:hypothetical protein n=1 Tax=Burkholderia pyrrocinia TaxID=60550 RepID=UPI0015751DB4|nr:hypothetical protein [Burkholderia pyrrocinia]NTX28276.1 hypothetical protein [Burkholderia pyrrocinia]